MTGWQDHQPVIKAPLRVSDTCLASLRRAVLSGSGAKGFAAQHSALADEGEVVVAAGGVGDGGAAVDRDANVGQVADIATVDPDRAARGVADTDGITGVAA